jgi:hypothetical protein
MGRDGAGSGGGLHEVTRAVGDAASTVLAHSQPDPHSFWRHLFDRPRERHYLDDVRAFVGALEQVTDVPPAELGEGDLREIAAQVDRVIEHIERHIDRSMDQPASAQPLARAVYAVRERHEQITARQRA